MLLHSFPCLRAARSYAVHAKSHGRASLLGRRLTTSIVAIKHERHFEVISSYRCVQPISGLSPFLESAHNVGSNHVLGACALANWHAFVKDAVVVDQDAACGGETVFVLILTASVEPC